MAQFGKLGVWDTEHNNGVLIYLLLAERHIELVADRELNRHVSPQAWQDMVRGLGQSLAIADVSTLLVAHFPLATGQVRSNAQPDQPALL